MNIMSIVASHTWIQCSQRFKNVKNITYLRFCLPWPWFICDLMVVHHVLQAILILLIVFLMWIIMNIGLFLFFSEQCWNVGWPSNVFDWGIWQSKSCSSVLQDGFAADSILNVCLFTRWSMVLDNPVLACQSKEWGFKFNDSNNLVAYRFLLCVHPLKTRLIIGHDILTAEAKKMESHFIPMAALGPV